LAVKKQGEGRPNEKAKLYWYLEMVCVTFVHSWKVLTNAYPRATLAKMTGYTKVFGSMLDSTVWLLSKEARILWLTMLLMKDRDQMVRAAIPGLAMRARLTLEETLSALKELGKPDQYSQNQEYEGRRVVEVEKGATWLVVSGAKYRDLMNREERLEYKRKKQAEYRARKKTLVEDARKAGAKLAIKDGLQERMEEDGEGTPLY